MIMTLETVKQELEQRRYPRILETDDYTGIIKATLREMTRYQPIIGYASFNSVANVQEYRIFDTEDVTTNGVCSNALNIRDAYYNPNWPIFSTVFSQAINFFHQPSQMTIIRQKLDAWRDQFGANGFEIVGMVGDPNSVLRLYLTTIPADMKIIVEFDAGYALDDITPAMEPAFMQWLEYHAADTIANLYAATAGINLLGFADSKEAMRYWENKAEKKYQRALAIQGGAGGQVQRS